MHGQLTHVTDSTLRALLWLSDACECLRDYKPAGYVVSTREETLLLNKRNLGYTPSSAADDVQAETWVEKEKTSL